MSRDEELRLIAEAINAGKLTRIEEEKEEKEEKEEVPTPFSRNKRHLSKFARSDANSRFRETKYRQGGLT